MTSSKKINTCEQGHIFIKNSSCLSCPVCEANNLPEGGFLSSLASVSRNVMKKNGISTLEQLSKFTEDELLAIPGMGYRSLKKLREALATANLTFKL